MVTRSGDTINTGNMSLSVYVCMDNTMASGKALVS